MFMCHSRIVRLFQSGEITRLEILSLMQYRTPCTFPHWHTPCILMPHYTARVWDAPTIGAFKDNVKLVDMGTIIEKAHFKN